MKTVESTVHCTRRAGALFRFPCAVMGNMSCNLLPAGVRLQRILEGVAEAPLLRRTMGTLNTGIGIDQGTGVYREDAAGRPVHDFRLMDQILDVMANPRSVPFLGVGFMPGDLSAARAATAAGPGHLPPEANKPGESWQRADRLPPKDYRRWYDLVFATVRHAVERYGERAVSGWYFDFWNEPDLPFYWRATPEEFFKTYDYAAQAVKDALPAARIGGCGPADPRAPIFRAFLEHCTAGRNACTGAVGAPLDFVTFHVKGGPTGNKGDFLDPWTATDYPRQHPSLRHIVEVVRQGLEIVGAVEGTRGLPVFLTECDIDWGTATSIYHNPNMHYRNSEYFAAFQCAMTRRLLDLRAQFPDNPIEALFLDTFLIPGRRLFEGQRTLVTGEGIEKPILNALRMVGMLGRDRLAVTEPAPSPVATLATEGGDGSLRILAVNFEETFEYDETFQVSLQMEGLAPRPWQCTHYRIDQDHSNAHTVWQALGRPLVPDAGQLAELRARQGLECLQASFTLDARGGRAVLQTVLPPHSVSLWVLR